MQDTLVSFQTLTRQPRRKKVRPERGRRDTSGTSARHLPESPPAPPVGLLAAEIPRYVEGWLQDGDIAQHSLQTRQNRELVIRLLLWHLESKGTAFCDETALRSFFLYCNEGHKEPGGRWGNPRNKTAVKPSTVASYFRHLTTFFTWTVNMGFLPSSPMAKIKSPIDRGDEVKPFTDEEVAFLFANAKKSSYPLRDYALVLFLLDTGLRASEVCGLRMSNLDMIAKRARVDGKGGKERTVSFGTRTARALLAYTQSFPRPEFGPVFLGERGAFTTSGLRQMIERLGEEIVPNQRRSYAMRKSRRPERRIVVDAHPHRFRHTFAVNYLMAGGDPFSLQMILGHTNSKMTQRYANFARADVHRKHRAHSPVEFYFNQKK